MMTNKKTRSSHLLKLLALVPIIGTALALNARTVTDYVYDEPQKKQIIKKGKANAKINAGNVGEVVVVEQAPAVQQDAKTYTIRGVVKDKDKKEPVVGAVIRVNGSKKGTVTDSNGEFSLEAKKGDRIEVMYVGYASGSIVVNDPQVKYDLRLQKDDSDESNTSGKPFDVVEQMPQFPGGPAALMEFLSKNVKYPQEAYKNGIQGRVIVTFVVNKDGSISDAKVVKSVDPQLDEEALRVVHSMPNWIPGRQNGEPVNVKYTVPITFKLQGDAKPATEKVIIGKEHKGKGLALVIDGKVYDVAELNGINPADIDSVRVEKAKDGMSKDRIIVKMKKK